MSFLHLIGFFFAVVVSVSEASKMFNLVLVEAASWTNGQPTVIPNIRSHLYCTEYSHRSNEFIIPQKNVTLPVIMIKISPYVSNSYLYCCSTQENCLIYCSSMDDTCKAFQFINGICWTSSAMSFYRYSNTNMQQISMWIAPDKATYSIKRKLSSLYLL